MKKLYLAGFWLAQYFFGVAAILAMSKDIHNLAIVFLALSYLSTMIGGFVLKISAEIQKAAHKSVPRLVELAWKFGCGLTIVMCLTLGTALGLVIFYFFAAIRDVFLARFYFERDIFVAPCRSTGGPVKEGGMGDEVYD